MHVLAMVLVASLPNLQCLLMRVKQPLKPMPQQPWWSGAPHVGSQYRACQSIIIIIIIIVINISGAFKSLQNQVKALQLCCNCRNPCNKTLPS
jgi:hypothetical protein